MSEEDIEKIREQQIGRILAVLYDAACLLKRAKIKLEGDSNSITLHDEIENFLEVYERYSAAPK